MSGKKTRILFTFTVVVICISFDQVSKCIVRDSIAPDRRISVIENVVTMTRVENTGAFMSMGYRLPRTVYRILMIVFPLAIIAYALYFILRNYSLPLALWLGIILIVGGGFGNLIDRVLYGSVTDFLQFNFGIFRTGIVNLADMLITSGFIILVVKMLFLHFNDTKKKIVQ